MQFELIDLQLFLQVAEAGSIEKAKGRGREEWTFPAAFLL
jgi:hypothetical protein